MKEILFKQVQEPKKDANFPVELTEETMRERKEKLLHKMKEEKLDRLIVYGDVEHAWNYAYLVGFYTRFEESLLMMDKEGNMTLVLGNENLKRYKNARFKCDHVHVSLFSLANQPNRNDKNFEKLLKEAGLKENERVGLAGWKNFTSTVDDKRYMFDAPAYITDAIRSVLSDKELLVNATELFIGDHGVRTTSNANEIAHYEYGAALASDCILDAMNLIDEGVSELQLGDTLERYGQHTTITTIAATGERFINGNMFPVNRKVQIGDPISLSVGYAGGSSSRAGYAVAEKEQLPEKAKNYMDELAKPYFSMYASWLENIKIGMLGGKMYDLVEEVFPKEIYHWGLCPGHLVAEEEWLSSPIYDHSEEVLKSGMMFQIDIIPSREGMSGVSAESTIVLADQELKEKIKEQYPEMWDRMMKRKEYIKSELNIQLSDDVLPMCITVGYLRPYMLKKDHAFVVK